MESRVLITGGTGSLGRALVNHLLQAPYNGLVEKIIVLSRDEVKQDEMANEIGNNDRLQFFLGDVRDSHRLQLAFSRVGVVIHAAALKRVDKVCFNPLEVKKTNVDGTQNVLDAAMKCGVSKVVVVSSDKACTPTNVYGATKMLAEHLTTAYNVYSYPKGTKCSVVRYGNVFNSRGSVMQVWSEMVRNGVSLVPVTSLNMTRFIITLKQAASLVCDKVVKYMQGGEIFVPRLPTMRLGDLVEAFDVKPVHMGLRPGGEKYHETLITREEADRTHLLLNGATQTYYILPYMSPWRADPFPESRANISEYTSEFANLQLSVGDLHQLIREECQLYV